MSSKTLIPRFLLPQRSSIWRPHCSTPINTSISTRHASHKGPQKSKSEPLVLEKPTKFNPPSHGSRIRKEAPRYPGPDLSAEEKAAQKMKKYPNMMPPEGTFLHWFITNRTIHMIITMGTLSSLALTVYITNLKRESQFAHMIPPWSQLFSHPIDFTRGYYEFLRMHYANLEAVAYEKRNRRVEEVLKRSAYRNAHGLNKDSSSDGWTVKTNVQFLEPAVGLEDTEKREDEVPPRQVERQVERLNRPPVKKWLGIW